jgi:carbamoyl-phosphate synthase large subunit
VDKRYLVPPVNDPGYIDAINAIIKKEEIDFLHIQPDVEVEFLAKNSEKIQTKTRLPEAQTVDICQDKMLFNQLLKENNIRVPESYIINNEVDLENAIAEILKNHEKARIRAIK